ncbi:MAG: alpha/beta fold hydrolase [Bacillota bacterium]|nr:alpha/beta fold hydrolase [Bacillota bacterium]
MREPVYFENQGQRLIGVLHKPEGAGPFPTVCFFHGFTGNKAEAHRIFVAQAEELVKNGISAFRFDFRGSGDSEGEFADMTFGGELSDALKAVEYLRGREDVADIAILGLSMGGALAAEVAGRAQGLKAAVLWSAVGNFMECHVGKNIARAAAGGFPIDWGGWLVSEQFVNDIISYNPFASIAKATAPVLLVHGTKDDAVQVEQVYEYDKVLTEAGVPHELKIIEGADHVYCRQDWKKEAIRTTTDFLVRHLK